MKRLYFLKLLFLGILFCFLKLIHAQNEVIKLWKSDIPGAKVANNYYEINDTIYNRISKVKNPTLTVFLPDQPNGSAMVICPGGGYGFIAMDKEGYKVAAWLNTLGITAFVLKYRLPSDNIMEDKSFGPLQDAQEAMRLIRRNAKKWQLNPDKIGIIGFSAGGHLASTLSTHYNDIIYNVADSISAKPNFSVLVYPVVSMDTNITHKGSRNRLLGTNPSKELIAYFSSEKHIDALTSPTFIVHASNDKAVPVENSLAYYVALRNNKVSAELHIYQDGKHGFGLGRQGTSKYWTKQCENWLRINKYIN